MKDSCFLVRGRKTLSEFESKLQWDAGTFGEENIKDEKALLRSPEVINYSGLHACTAARLKPRGPPPKKKGFQKRET